MSAAFSGDFGLWRLSARAAVQRPSEHTQPKRALFRPRRTPLLTAALRAAVHRCVSGEGRSARRRQRPSFGSGTSPVSLSRNGPSRLKRRAISEVRRGWGGMPVARFLKYRKARLIRMAKLGCGALASGFIASHHACANSADSPPGKFSRKGAGPVSECARRVMSGTLRSVPPPFVSRAGTSSI